jgi:primosomal protein N' (replication factor Y) (superfamily II helicase)
MQTQPRYAEVILPVPLPGMFTYAVPDELAEQVCPGKRVVVSFGKKRILLGMVRTILDQCNDGIIPKEILAVMDDKPLVTETHLSFWDWIVQYYLCNPGEILVAALPGSFRLESETGIELHPDFDGDTGKLSDKEFLVVEALQFTPRLTISDISEIVDQKRVMNLVNSLIEKNIVVSTATITEVYRPKTITIVRLGEKYHAEETLNLLMDELGKRAFKQLSLLMAFLQVAGLNLKNAAIRKKELVLMAGASLSAYNALCDKGVFEEFSEEVSRLGNFEAVRNINDIVLNEMQESALEGIQEGFAKNLPVLLHGVTGSGKTEVYIRLMNDCIRSGRQVLYLLPEIALTSQIINRLRAYFGNKVQLFHSRYSEQERTELWNRIVSFSGLHDDPWIIVGARSSLFLPMTDAGLIIVDEEHDHSFKQFDPAPRYQARDAAVMLAAKLKIPVILGTATPSLESYHNARTGKYWLVNLPVRYGKSAMPTVYVADVAESQRRREMKSHFTPLLITHIKQALETKQQVILFQNRRGFSLRVFCTVCGWHPGCPHCDVTLTYHKYIDKLKCHYCGFQTIVPKRCSDCGSDEVRTAGFGTEKIEEDIAILFPKARVRRMDFDTTRTKNAYQAIIGDFEQRVVDILVGTQMVTKGLDFSNVGVVGVMNADAMIAFPDFRSHERSFQHIVQVSGRAGRQSVPGFVVIQTGRPSHDIIKLARDHNFTGMYEMEINERKQFFYPPFSRLVKIICKSKDARILSQAAMLLAGELRDTLGNYVLGPEYPLVSKIKSEYIRHILIKIVPDKKLTAKKLWIRHKVASFQSNDQYRKVRFVLDVDPY